MAHAHPPVTTQNPVGRAWLQRTAWAVTTTVATWASVPAAQAATAASAQVSISNVTVSISALDAEPWVTGNWPWIVQNTGPGWPATAESTGVVVDLVDAAAHDESSGWIGTSRVATVSAANASASAGVSFSGADLTSAGAAWSFASASNGEAASAAARLWDAAFMVGARTRVFVTLTLDTLSAAGNGGTAMALASLGMWNADLGTNFVSADAQAIDTPDFSVSYDGPYTLSVTWDNASTDLVVAQMSLLTSAQAISAVPEPAPGLMLLAGLFAVAGMARPRRQAAGAGETK